MHTHVVTLHQADVLAARAIGVEVAAHKTAIGADEGQLGQNFRHHAGFVRIAGNGLAVVARGLHIGLQAQQGLVGHLQHTQRVLLQGQGSVTVFPLLCAQSVLPLPPQHQGNADPHNHQHGRTERNSHPCQPQGPTPSPMGHSRRGYGLTRSRRNTHSRLAGMVSVNCAVGTIRWNCAPPCGALVA